MEFWNWYVDSFSSGNLAREGLVAFFTLMILLVVISQIHRALRKGRRKIQEIRVKSDEELAYQQHGAIPKGCKIYVFAIETGCLVREHTDRYRSSRELDPDKYEQICSFSYHHAEKKFKRKYPINL